MEVMTDSCKDAPSSLVKVVLRMGSWVIRFAFSFQFYSRRTTAFAEPSCKFNLTLAVGGIEKLAIIWVGLKKLSRSMLVFASAQII